MFDIIKWEGEINLKSIGLKFVDNISEVKIDGENVDFEFKNGVIYFNKTGISNCVEIIM